MNKNYFKYIIVILLLLCFCFYFSSCGSNSSIAGGTETGNTETTIYGSISFEQGSSAPALAPSKTSRVPSLSNINKIIVELENTKYSTIADASGNYIFNNVEPGTYDINVRIEQDKLIKYFSFPIEARQNLTTLHRLDIDKNWKPTNRYEITQAGVKEEIITRSDGKIEKYRNNEIYSVTPTAPLTPENISFIKIFLPVGYKNMNVDCWPFFQRCSGMIQTQESSLRIY